MVIVNCKRVIHSADPIWRREEHAAHPVHGYRFERVLIEKQIRERSSESLPPGVVDYRCRATIAVIAGKWKTAIINTLYGGRLRFGALLRRIPNARRKVLTEQLRQLQRDGVVSRVALGARSQRVEYSLTEYGRTLIPVITVLAVWGDTHLKTTQTQRLGPRQNCENQCARYVENKPSGAEQDGYVARL